MFLNKNSMNTPKEVVLNSICPEGTDTHKPVPHSYFLERADHYIDELNLKTEEQKFWLSWNEMKYAGVYVFDKKVNTEGDEKHQANIMLSFINSHDKTMTAGVFFGTHVPVCTNVGWWNSFWFKRKHTGNIEADLEIGIKACFNNLDKFAIGYNDLMASYKSTPLSDYMARGLMIEGAKQKVIPPSKVLSVLKEWEKPSFEYEDNDKNLYRLHNAFTTVMRCYKDNPISAPQRSFKLMNVFTKHVGYNPFEDDNETS